MAVAYFVTHPEVVIDPEVPVPQWGLSSRGHERLQAFCARPFLNSVTDVFVSDERKALDCAETLKSLRNLEFRINPRLGENDRTSTGYVAPPRFWEIVAEFFAHPDASVLGWETAADAQRRVKAAVTECIRDREGKGDVVIFSHGGVGTLLLCDLLGEPISQNRGQPISGGGCYFAFDADTLSVIHAWQDIVPDRS
ncbi:MULTISPECIES: histidine phosphatase family protein [unclassified Mesorhizobium]|uniref:histidine phosphatase family protein n=1 Tax=unclassified Mesorhizobium TaxID=325217 RepID=UPI0030153994